MLQPKEVNRQSCSKRDGAGLCDPRKGDRRDNNINGEGEGNSEESNEHRR